MSGGHRALHLERTGPLHDVAAHAKLVGMGVFVFAVVCTPREQFWAFAVDALVVASVALVAGMRITTLVRRLGIELPFVAFALALPFVGRGPTVQVAGVALSQPGLWAAWGIIARGTLGVACTVLVASTTPVPRLIAGLERLRVPRTVTAITSFMVRYGDVLTDQLHRMRVARLSRGDRARWLWQARAVGATGGTLFVRSYERGERVFLAMQSRGYVGAMPELGGQDAPPRWWLSLTPGAIAWCAAAAAWITR